MNRSRSCALIFSHSGSFVSSPDTSFHFRYASFAFSTFSFSASFASCSSVTLDAAAFSNRATAIASFAVFVSLPYLVSFFGSNSMSLVYMSLGLNRSINSIARK